VVNKISQEDLLSQDNSIQNTQESQEDLLSQDNSIQNTQESQESGAKEDLQTQREEILEISTQYFRSSNQQLIAEEMPQESQGDYVFYNSELIGSTQDTVIFFHASWCASCRAAEEGILAGKIPDTLTILKANFDSELELRKKY
jgi:thiol-disulfide isomerase/thioredoxin